MNSKGFFCFLLLLAFLAIELEFLDWRGKAGDELFGARASAFEVEKLALVRSLLEESADNAVEGALGKGLILELEPEEIKAMANARLVALFAEAERAYGIVEFDPRAKSQGFLNENSSVLVTRLGRKKVQAEYHFSGGIMKNNFVLGKLRGRESVAEFRLPVGYTASATVVG